MPANRQILLDSRPEPGGRAATSHFRLVTTETARVAAGEVLVRHEFLSLDPYMRSRMNDARSYAPPVRVGEVMVGATAGVVLESRHPGFVAGDTVVGMGGWQEYCVVSGDSGSLRKVNASRVPLSHFLGAVGTPGVTAWYGLNEILRPAPGQTLLVTAASGAVGSAVGVLAKSRGCRVIGIAGGPEKCRYVTDDLGFDACLDHRRHTDASSLSRALKAECPDGLQLLFENVGGLVMDAAMLRMDPHGRIALCGMVAGYEGTPVAMAYPQLIVTKRLMVQGFVIHDHAHVWLQALSEMEDLVAGGKLRPRESVAVGLAAAPNAFVGLLEGRNFGKQLVRL